MRSRPASVPGRAADVALAVGVALLQTATITTGGGVAGGAAGAVAGALGLAQGGLLLARRRRPGLVPVAVCLAYAGQAALAGVVLPAAPWVALFLLPPAAGTLRAAAAGLILLLGGFGAGAWARPSSGGVVPLLVALSAVVVLAGAVRAALRGRAEALAGRAEEMRRRVAAQERLALARELHDSIGHALTTIAVQSSAARMALDAGSEASARPALSAVESSSRAALREMRDLVGVLRAVQADFTPAATLADLPALVERVRDSGVAVQLHLAPGLEAAPAQVQATVYRIVQEGLTNVVRHAWGGWAQARVEAEEGLVRVTVVDGGGSDAEPPPDDGKGWGLTGLRERVQLVGGSLDAGPAAAGTGWNLTATLPLEPGEAP